MKDNTSRGIRVGFLAALGFIIIFLAFFLVGGEEGIFTRTCELKARFQNVEGLTIGAPVRLGGVKVGTVSGIGFSEDRADKTIVVTMSVDHESFKRIGKDSQARLGSKGLLGDRTVDITMGTPESERCQPGDFIPTLEAYQIDDLISESGDVMTDIKLTASDAREIAWKINRGEGTLGQFINDPRMYTNLDSLLVLWTNITYKIRSGEGTLSEFINDPVLYEQFTRLTTEAADFIQAANEGGGALGKLANESDLYDHTDSLLINLNKTLEKINSGEGTLGQIATDAEMYRKLLSAIESLDSLLVDIKAHPKRYVKLSLF
ncbi:MAG: MCE family protein [Candidatus Zixiibacteriota bacterium]|nr:MAG: MCE family protein [candidate division Zixibacteria bacterium]